MTGQTHPTKITVLRLSAIGDVLMLLPAVRLLKKTFPETQIDWLIDQPIASLLSEVSEINVVPIKKPRSIRDYWQLKHQWQNNNTGQLISFQTSLVSNLVMMLLPADHKTGFGKPYSREGHHLFVDTAYDLPKNLHQVEIFFALAQKFSGLTDKISISAEDLKLPVNSIDTGWAKEQLKPNQSWIAINPMASTQEKTWATENYITLFNELQKNHPEYQIVLTGGPSEKEIKLSKAIQAQTTANVLNLVGKTTLTQLAAVFEQVDLLIAPDTGPLHLANAVATPAIGLYAVTRPEYIGPYNQQHNCINIYPQSAERFMQASANQLPWQKKIPSLDAMQMISVQQVLDKIHSVLLWKF